MACLTDDEVAELVEGRLSTEALARVDHHMATCAACRGLVADLAKATFDDVADAPEPEPNPLPKAGDRVGRYRLLEILGVGGMGMVFSGEDPELHRTIALKLIRTDLIGTSGSGSSDELQKRLHQEARAMAKISHPNVVAVHDIGTIDGHLFVAMEYVKGTTLRGYCEDKPWPEIVEAYLAAGAGLRAAHEAGLVHRDFKPENVLCGEDGRVRVTDFGLARGDLQVEEQALGLTAEVGISSVATVTRAGQLIGTPAYMAPEQILGLPADARSDQFSFCVALFEALYGTRPYPAKDIRELAQKIALGKQEPRPSSTSVPAKLHPILVRGLRSSPAERFPSMQALLDELTKFKPRPKRSKRASRRLQAFLGVVLVGGGVAVWQATKPPAPPPRPPARPALSHECRNGPGLYCAGHGVDGNRATLYRCDPEGVREEKKCSMGCMYLIGNGVDRCDVDTAKCPLGNGVYCGENHLSADPKILYKCTGGTLTVENVCERRCVKEPNGIKDHCDTATSY